MTRLAHVIGRAIGGLRAAPFVHSMAALTLAVALVLGGLAIGGGLAARALLDAWGAAGSELTIYLVDGLSDAHAEALRSRVEARVGAPAALVSPAVALERLRGALKDDAHLLDDLPVNPLLASIEVRPAVSDPAALLDLAAELRVLPEVDQVDAGPALDPRVIAIGTGVQTLGAALLVVILLGAAALAGSAVRLGVWVRREEIEILRLVGATPRFVRAPFLVEGLLAGLAGGVVAAVVLWILAARATPYAASLPLPAHLAPEALASGAHLALVIAAGALFGLVSSAVSVGRHLRG